MGLVSRLVPPLSRDQLKQGLVQIVRRLQPRRHDRREGSRHRRSEVGALPGVAGAKANSRCGCSRCGRAPDNLEDRAAVMARVKANPRQAGLAAGGMLVSGGVKMFMDGSGGARTAWMHERLEQEPDRGRQGQHRLSVDRPGGVPADRHRTPRRGRPRQHARHRRPRHRLGGRYLRSGAAGQADARPAPRDHPRQHADRSRHRRHGAPAARLRRRLSRSRPPASCGGLATTTPPTWARSATCG